MLNEAALFERLIEEEQALFKSILDPVIQRAKQGLGAEPQPTSEGASMLGLMDVAAPRPGPVLVGDPAMVCEMQIKIKREQSNVFFRNLRPKVAKIKGV